MKKVIALALALVMVLGLAVSAFAIELKPVKDEEVEAEKIYELGVHSGTSYMRVGKGGTYYVEVEGASALKDLKVETTGCCTAELVKFDGSDEKVNYVGLTGAYYYVEALAKVGTSTNVAKGTKLVWNAPLGDTTVDENEVAMLGTGYNTYAEAKALAKAMNKWWKTDKFVVKANDNLPTLVKITVADNYTAAYKEGEVIVTGTQKTGDKKAVKATITVISDVAIFAYEDVKAAADNKVALDNTYTGYSDYETAKVGYKTADLSLVSFRFNPTVVSTTAFRAIAGKGISYEDSNVTVEIPAVAEGQKGVNFRYGTKINYTDDKKTAVKSYEFGFKGNQVIASDFTVTLSLETGWFGLRESFKEKLEENDIITFYVLKDGKLYDKVTVDYKDVDLDEEVELEINGKAGDTLGWYTLQLTAPAEETEENPNTGAESMIGAVVALAVVSMASAAAVSLKK